MCCVRRMEVKNIFEGQLAVAQAAANRRRGAEQGFIHAAERCGFLAIAHHQGGLNLIAIELVECVIAGTGTDLAIDDRATDGNVVIATTIPVSHHSSSMRSECAGYRSSFRKLYYPVTCAALLTAPGVESYRTGLRSCPLRKHRAPAGFTRKCCVSSSLAR